MYGFEKNLNPFGGKNESNFVPCVSGKESNLLREDHQAPDGGSDLPRCVSSGGFQRKSRGPSLSHPGWRPTPSQHRMVHHFSATICQRRWCAFCGFFHRDHPAERPQLDRRKVSSPGFESDSPCPLHSRTLRHSQCFGAEADECAEGTEAEADDEGTEGNFGQFFFGAEADECADTEADDASRHKRNPLRHPESSGG